jgi:SacI restriction endonuclease
LDCQFGPDRIKVSRVNDPSRKYPGDVGVFKAGSKKDVERSFEVRDKNVTPSDLRIFATRALEKGVTKIAMAALAENQERFDPTDEMIWAARRGVRLGVFFGVAALLEQALFWSENEGVLTGMAIERVLERAEQIEISEAGLAILQSLSSV